MLDQIKSPTPGIIEQLTGRLTTKSYNILTIFFDQATIFSYAHFQTTDSSELTLKAKQKFELMEQQHGVKIEAYQADNYIFQAQAWVKSFTKQSQALIFSGVNAHHENGITERRIRHLQDLTRMQLIHAAKRWQLYITANQWPYTLHTTKEITNNTPSF